LIRDYSAKFLSDLSDALDDGLRAASRRGSDIAALSMRPAPGAEGQLIRHRVSSSPGNPPFVRTGRLRSSLAYEKTGPLAWGFGTSVRYGRLLERGTSRMKSRPFLRPVLIRNGKDITREFVFAVKRKIGGGQANG